MQLLRKKQEGKILCKSKTVKHNITMTFPFKESDIPLETYISTRKAASPSSVYYQKVNNHQNYKLLVSM